MRKSTCAYSPIPLYLCHLICEWRMLYRLPSFWKEENLSFFPQRFFRAYVLYFSSCSCFAQNTCKRRSRHIGRIEVVRGHWMSVPELLWEYVARQKGDCVILSPHSTLSLANICIFSFASRHTSKRMMTVITQILLLWTREAKEKGKASLVTQALNFDWFWRFWCDWPNRKRQRNYLLRGKREEASLSRWKINFNDERKEDLSNIVGFEWSSTLTETLDKQPGIQRNGREIWRNKKRNFAKGCSEDDLDLDPEMWRVRVEAVFTKVNSWNVNLSDIQEVL